MPPMGWVVAREAPSRFFHGRKHFPVDSNVTSDLIRYMIETDESRRKSDADRQAAKKYLRGKFGLKTAAEILPQATEEHLLSEHGLSTTSVPCPICEERKRKSRERVKRHRSKSK